MFTERFLKVPVIKYSNYEEEILGKDSHDCEKYICYKRINPFEIEAYEGAIPKGEELNAANEKWTYIFMKSGQEFYLNITVKEFEKLLNEHQK